MHAYSHYVVAILGDDEDVSVGMEFLKETVNEDIDINPIVMIDENYDIVWIHDIIEMAIETAKKIPDSKFVFSGFVDCTENCGEVMQFGIVYENQELKIYNSDWIYFDDDIEEIYYNLESYATDDEALVEDCFEEIVSDIQSKNWNNYDTIDI